MNEFKKPDTVVEYRYPFFWINQSGVRLYETRSTREVARLLKGQEFCFEALFPSKLMLAILLGV